MIQVIGWLSVALLVVGAWRQACAAVAPARWPLVVRIAGACGVGAYAVALGAWVCVACCAALALVDIYALARTLRRRSLELARGPLELRVLSQLIREPPRELR